VTKKLRGQVSTFDIEIVKNEMISEEEMEKQKTVDRIR